ncbi:ABC transporter substrate-binding protein [Glycomyces sp. NPDC048151]|uniref:ABC transporter substrate-binding protein n=1 Tax=Glycomyces sp. NPDC048151 TaxID=3364002 RepID=UPI0037137EB7
MASTTADAAARRNRVFALVLAACLLVLGAVAFTLLSRGTGAEPVYIAVAGNVDDSGQGRHVESDLLPGVRIAVDKVNAAGGIDGRPVELLVYADGDDPLRAKANAEAIAADDRVAAVIGHTSTAASMAAYRAYANAGIPVISPVVTSDALTADRPWYFQGIFDDSQQGTFLAAYIGSVLDLDRATVVWGDDGYGSDVRAGFVSAYQGQVHDLPLTLDSANLNTDGLSDATGAAIDALVGRIAADPDRGAIVLGLRPDAAERTISGLRAAGVTEPVIGGNKLSSEAFTAEIHQALVDQGATEAELAAPVYATAPMLTDSLTGAALEFVQTFVSRYGYVPDWPAVTGSDTVTLIAAGLAGTDPADVPAAREDLRAAWEAMTDPGTAAEGLTGPLYFEDRTLVRPVRMGVFNGARPVSAPVQLVPYDPASGQDVAAELAAGEAVRFEQEVLIPTQIVSTGFNVNEIRDLNTQAGTFAADMFVWFTYTGGDEVTDVWFPNAADKNLALGEPLEAKQVGDTKYRLYHVEGVFEAQLVFRSFPFDRQHLPIVLQHRTLPDSSVVYVLDATVRSQSQAERLTSAGDSSTTIDRIPNWQVDSLYFHAETVGTTANLGDPESDSTGVHYSQFVTDIEVRRDVGGFLVKNLLPLCLLVLATYVSLFLGYDAVTSRVSMAITGILSSAVMLNSVTSVLPAISYTVAIEWLYYLFILICVGLLVVDLVGSSWAAKGRKRRLRWLTVGSRIAYPVIVLTAAATYWIVFS